MSTVTDGFPESRRRDRLLGIQELAEFIGVPRQTIYRWRGQGRGPKAAKLGRHLRYRQADIDEWLRSQTDNGDLVDSVRRGQAARSRPAETPRHARL